MRMDMLEDLGFQVRDAGIKGKGLFATRPFKSGDTIFEEIPLVSCQFPWNIDYGYLACDHCIMPLESAQENARRLSMNQNLVLPYPEACTIDLSKHTSCPSCGVKYCSIECQNVAWNEYHRTLCLQKFERDNSHLLEQLKELWKQVHYPPESATIMLLTRIIAKIQQSQDKQSMQQRFLQFRHKTVNEEIDAAHKLLGEQFSSQIEILRDCFVEAVHHENVENWITPDGFLSLLALVATNGQGIGTSAISQWVKNASELSLSADDKQNLDTFIDKMYEDFDKAVGDFLNNEGSGLYSLQSTCNHSCLPNAETNFPYNNFKLVLSAKRDIEPGEEICVSYLDECLLERSRHTRRKILMCNYLFDCTCTKCEEQQLDPDETSEEDFESDSE